MNEIESKFLDAFNAFVKESFKFSIYDDTSKKKVADCEVSDPFCDFSDSEYGCFVQPVFFNLGALVSKVSFTAFFFPQKQVGPYQVDFLFALEDEYGFIQEIAVEIDGHEWHEKNKAQAAYDKKRDRYLLASKTPVMRFTGSEVYTNPTSCIQEVFSCAVLLSHERLRLFSSHYEKKISERNKFFGLEASA